MVNSNHRILPHNQSVLHDIPSEMISLLSDIITLRICCRDILWGQDFPLPATWLVEGKSSPKWGITSTKELGTLHSYLILKLALSHLEYSYGGESGIWNDNVGFYMYSVCEAQSKFLNVLSHQVISFLTSNHFCKVSCDEEDHTGIPLPPTSTLAVKKIKKYCHRILADALHCCEKQIQKPAYFSLLVQLLHAQQHAVKYYCADQPKMALRLEELVWRKG